MNNLQSNWISWMRILWINTLLKCGQLKDLSSSGNKVGGWFCSNFWGKQNPYLHVFVWFLVGVLGSCPSVVMVSHPIADVEFFLKDIICISKFYLPLVANVQVKWSWETMFSLVYWPLVLVLDPTATCLTSLYVANQ